MGHPVSFFQIQGREAEPLIEFYQTAFGWQGNPAPDGGLMVTPEEGGIPGAVGPSRDESAHLALYITVKDVTEHLARAEAAGATIAMREIQLSGDMGAIGGILDPAGNWVGLWSPPPGLAPAPPRKKAAARKPAKKAKKKPAKKARSTKKAAKKSAKKPAKKASRKSKKKASKKAKKKARRR